MIVVATRDFELYHGAVSELRDRGVTFTTIEPDGIVPEGTTVLVTASDDDLEITSASKANNAAADDAGPAAVEPSNLEAEAAGSERSGNEHGADDPIGNIEVVIADPAHPRGAIDEALALVRGVDGRTVIGVDPGERPGIAVCTGGIVVAAFQVPAGEAAAVIRREAETVADPVIRVGDGARLKSASIIDGLGDLPVELVDETGTTPYLGSGARGTGDVLAAANIARLPGERVETREVDPTPGEIDRIKRRSRERSDGGRTIDAALARRVARGELTVEQALAEHRND